MVGNPEKTGLREWFWPIMTGAAYALAALLSFLLARNIGGSVIFWPGIGIFLAGMMLARTWEARLATAACVATACFAVSLPLGEPIEFVIGGLIAEQTCVAAIVALLSLLQKGPLKDSIRNFIPFALSCAVGAAASTAIASLWGGNLDLGFIGSWFATMLLGILLVTPLVLLTADAIEQDQFGRVMQHTGESLAILMLVSAATVAVFAQAAYPVAYLPAVACMLAAFRLGPLGAAAAIAIIALIGSFAIALNIGPLHLVGDISAVVYYFQAYLLILTLASLPLAASLLRREEMLTQLKKSNELLEMAEKEANLGHWHVDFRNKTIYWSREMFVIHGMDPNAGQPTLDEARNMTLPEDREMARRVMDTSIAEKSPYRMVGRTVRTDGTVRSIESYGKPELDHRGRVIGIFGTFQDVTERVDTLKALKDAKRAAEIEAANIRQLAETDELTGMANRRKILSVLSSAIQTCEESSEDLSVGILDIDHFKMINDTFGHAAGDIVLRKIAKIAKLNLQVSDIIGRLGGEEFLIIMPGTNSDVAHEKLERLRIAIEQSDWSEMGGMPVTGSFGVASMTEGADETWLLQAADNALYEAKRSGRNCLRAAA